MLTLKRKPPQLPPMTKNPPPLKPSRLCRENEILNPISDTLSPGSIFRFEPVLSALGVCSKPFPAKACSGWLIQWLIGPVRVGFDSWAHDLLCKQSINLFDKNP